MKGKIKGKHLKNNNSVIKKNNKLRGKKIYKDDIIYNSSYINDKIDKVINLNKQKIKLEYEKKDKKLKKIQWLFFGMVILLIGILLLILSIPKIYLDNSNNSIRYNGEYKNTGYVAKSVFKDYSNSIKIDGVVDTSKVGEYKLKYILDFAFLTITREKKIEVIDDVAPNITLNGESKVVLCPNTKYIEAGYKANDEYDGDISDKVKVEVMDDEIRYNVIDNSGNVAEVIRNIEYIDNDKPELKLIGSQEVTLYKGDIYKEEGYSAIDNCDGDITNKVKVINNVDTNTVGSYEIKYQIVDISGNEESVVRKIKVVNKKISENATKEGIIYLTFDDGPSDLTLEILKILKKADVKATFFVTGEVDNYQDILKEEYVEGHSIALHTYSHNYSYIYSNVSNFFSDIGRVNDSVEKITGIKSKIIRFPGGSSNTISKKYYSGIMSILTNEVIKRGYSYFDWNIDSDDAGGAFNDSNRIYSNVISNLDNSRVNVVLMHDSSSHMATVDALERIIAYGKNNHYSFGKIDSNTKMIIHSVNN